MSADIPLSPKTPCRDVSPTLTALAQRLDRASDAERAALVERFWDSSGARSPLIEPSSGGPDEQLVTFVFRDATAHAVLISLNRITHDLEDARLERMAGTDIWHTTFRLASTWRGSYTVAAVDPDRLAELVALEPRWAIRTLREDGEPDPRNPETCHAHGDTHVSVAALPDAPSQPWLTPPTAAAKGCTSEHVSPTGRRVWVYRPAGPEQDPRPLVIALDGDVWHGSGYAAAAVDTLAAAGAIRAPYVAMPDAGPRQQRMRDLSIDGGMSAEIVDVLLPWLRSFLPVSADPREVIVSGESLGGLTALKTVFDHPEITATALGQSASLWQHDMLDRAAHATRPVRIFQTAGRHETGLVEHNRALSAALHRSAHQHTYVEYDGGHDMACWRGFWADGLRVLLGDDVLLGAEIVSSTP